MTMQMNLLDQSKPLAILPDQSESWQSFKEPISFDAAAQLVLTAAQHDGARTDRGVGDLSTWLFGPTNDGHAAITPMPVPGRPQVLVPLREHAFRQLCARTGAPSGYIEKLPMKLQMACMNHGMQRGDANGKAALVRFAGDSARAIVSDRYAALDDAHVLETLRASLHAAGRLSDVRVRAVAVGTTTAMRLTFPDHAAIVRSPQVNDIVEVGLDVVNGEIGNRAIAITPSTFRLVCLNGMRRQHKEVAHRLRHTGDPKRLAEAFQDALPVAIAGGEQLRARMAMAVDRLVDDVLGELDGLSAFGLQANEVRDVTRELAAGVGLVLPSNTAEWTDPLATIRTASMYDVANAVTHFAQSRGTDRRLELEESAAQYLYRRVA